MTTVERVKKLCKERGVPVSRLERECGFANAYISQLKKGTVPADRLKKIADYFDVPMDYFVSGYYQNEETASEAQEMFDDPDMRALFHMKKKMSPERFKAHKKMMTEMYKLEHPEDDYDFDA